MKFSFRFDIVKFSLCTTNKERWIFTNIYYFYLSVPISAVQSSRQNRLSIDQDWEKLFCRRCFVYIKWVPTYSTIIAKSAECDTLIRILDIVRYYMLRPYLWRCCVYTNNNKGNHQVPFKTTVGFCVPSTRNE